MAPSSPSRARSVLIGWPLREGPPGYHPRMPSGAPLVDPTGFPQVSGASGELSETAGDQQVSWADPGALDAAAALLRALASPVRVRLVLHLARGPRCVHDLVDAVGLPQPLVSQHLRVLRISRLVRAERAGREIVYSLVDGHVAHVVADAVAHARESPS